MTTKRASVVVVVLMVLCMGFVSSCHLPPPGPVQCALTKAAESCWNTNTGVSGTLAMFTGEYVVTDANPILEDTFVLGCIAVRVTDITQVHMDNVKVVGTQLCSPRISNDVRSIIAFGSNNEGYSGFADLRNIEVDATGATSCDGCDDVTAIGQTNYYCTHCKVRGAHKAFKGDGPTIVADAYVPTTRDSQTHTDTFFYDGGGQGAIYIGHSWMRNSNIQQATGVVVLINDYPNSHGGITVENNYLANDIERDNAGGNGIAGGAFCGKTIPPEHTILTPFFDHVKVTGNVIAWRSVKVAAYGYWPAGPSNVWGGSGQENIFMNADETSSSIVPAPNPDGGCTTSP